MWVSTETIYQSLYVQSRGALRRELTACLRTGRALRQPGRHSGTRQNRMLGRDMINISQRPAEADDRAMPGHWEGDLMIGKRNQTAIATLVERSTGYAMLVALPGGYKPEQVAPALAAKIQTLPEALRRSLTWDQGPEMRDWKQVRIDAGIEVYFCDPHAPWQRGSNENTNGLLRQYFPKGIDFATVTETELDAVADELNDRPRKRFAFATPTEQISESSCCNNRQNPPNAQRDAATAAGAIAFASKQESASDQRERRPRFGTLGRSQTEIPQASRRRPAARLCRGQRGHRETRRSRP